MILICHQCRREIPLQERSEGEVFACLCGAGLTVPKPQAFHAAVWHCGSCGAGLAVGVRECGYCGTGLRPLDGKAFCARCLAYLEAGAQFCSHCGSHALEAGAVPQTTEKTCPRCSGSESLVGVPVGYHHGEACPRCEGLWLSQATLLRVVRDFSDPSRQKPQGSGIAKPNSANPETSANGEKQQSYRITSATGGYEAKVVYLPCPICKVRMARQNYLKISGIILDACPDHGIWFDRDELRRVAEFLQSGGTVRAQRFEAEALKIEKRHGSAMANLERGATRHESTHSWPAGINDAPSMALGELLLEFAGWIRKLGS